jgi:AcrR family transcriptional regulator
MPNDDWVVRIVRGRQEIGREHSATSQRVELLDAMARAVAEKGYAETTVADVAERAGVPNSTFLDHFPDTESCFLAAYDMGSDVLLTTAQDGIGSADRPPMERYGRLLTSYLDLLAAEPAFSRAFLVEIYAAGPRAIQRHLDVLESWTDLLAEIFAPLGADGEGVDRFACEAIVGAITSLVTTRVARGDFDQLPALREPLMGFVRCALAPAGEEPEAPQNGVSVDSPV